MLAKKGTREKLPLPSQNPCKSVKTKNIEENYRSDFPFSPFDRFEPLNSQNRNNPYHTYDTGAGRAGYVTCNDYAASALRISCRGAEPYNHHHPHSPNSAHLTQAPYNPYHLHYLYNQLARPCSQIKYNPPTRNKLSEKITITTPTTHIPQPIPPTLITVTTHIPDTM